ncbi:MAG: hypothetical protein ACON5F_13275 [Jejuia sp.]
MKISEFEQKDIVSKLKNSNTFKNAPTSIALLQYVFDATSQGVRLKESIIDIEFFKNENIQEKTNPRVRVNVHNLRKKITKFYETEGKDDLWRLKIEKGQYKVSFYKRDIDQPFFKKFNWSQLIPYILLIVSMGCIVALSLPESKPDLWQPFLSKTKQTNLYIGDHFGITGKTITKNTGWTRDFSINSFEDFYDFLEENPKFKDSLKPSQYSYSTRMGALTTQKIQSFFQNFNTSFKLRFSTQTSTSEIKEGNAIYVGPSKNNNQFLSFFNQANPYFEISSTSLQLSNHPTIRDSSYSLNTFDFNKELAIVSKYKSGDDEHFVFFSQHDIGVTATVEYFTNIDSLRSFSRRYLKDNSNFTAIFEVQGQDRTNTSLKKIQVVPF